MNIKLTVKYILIANLLTFSSFAPAQTQKSVTWADNVLVSMESDLSKEKYFDTLLNIYKDPEYACKWIKTMLYKSGKQGRLGKFKEALQSLTIAENKYLLNTCKDKTVLPEIYLAYSRLYTLFDERKKAMHYAQIGIDAWPTVDANQEVYIKLFIAKGGAYIQLDSQLLCYRIAYKKACKIKNLKLQETSLNQIGIAFAINEQVDSALVYLKLSLQYALKRKAYNVLSSMYNNLAGLSSNYQLIDAYLDSSFYYAEISGDLDAQQTVAQNRALFYYQNGKFEEGYDQLWLANTLKDSLFKYDKISAFAEMEQKYESEKKAGKIKGLQQEKEIADLNIFRSKVINYGLGCALIVFIFMAAGYYDQNKKRMKLNIALSAEKQKSDDLLLNILPSEIAEELKDKGMAEAKLFDEVTVLFTDFKDFTGLTERLSPSELVALIDYCFKGFDNIISKYNIEKIKTIGDSYMCAGGLPVANHTNARDIVSAALEINKYIIKYSGNRVASGLAPIGIRIGIHTGPVVAGIVGIKKFAYDIWGDTVNTASRMESSCEVNKVNISESTHHLIRNDFIFESRGKIIAKNKGEIDMYYVLGPIE